MKYKIFTSKNWWTKYYTQTKATEADLQDANEALQEEGLEDEYNVVGVLEAKPEYEQVLSSQDIQMAYLSNKAGDMQVFSVVMGRIFPVTEEDILNHLEEADEETDW